MDFCMHVFALLNPKLIEQDFVCLCFAKAEIDRSFINCMKSLYDASPVWEGFRTVLGLDSPSPPPLSPQGVQNRTSLFYHFAEPAGTPAPTAAFPPYETAKHAAAESTALKMERSEEQPIHPDLSLCFRMSSQLRGRRWLYAFVEWVLWSKIVSHLITFLMRDLPSTVRADYFELCTMLWIEKTISAALNRKKAICIRLLCVLKILNNFIYRGKR